VSPAASAESIKAAFRKLALTMHPDVCTAVSASVALATHRAGGVCVCVCALAQRCALSLLPPHKHSRMQQRRSSR
jgi:hypothetical protein